MTPDPAFAPHPVSIRRETPGMIALRCAPDEARLAPAFAAIGLAASSPRRIAGDDGTAVAWMSPDEWLLFLPRGAAASRLADLGRALGDAHHLALDVSDARAVFRLDGPGARHTLAKGAPVDLAPQAFGPGDFRRTRLGQVACAIWTTDGVSFGLMCFRSVADHVALWLANAAGWQDPSLILAAGAAGPGA